MSSKDTSASKPTFDEWHVQKYGLTFEERYHPYMSIRTAHTLLFRDVRDYVTELARGKDD